MNIRGRVMKLEKVSGKAARQAGILTDPVLWAHRFRAADPANEQIFQDICAYWRAIESGVSWERDFSQLKVMDCFRAIYFPIVHAVNMDSEPHYDGFAQTPELLRRLVRTLWQYLRADCGPFPLYHHWIEGLAGAKGAGMRDLWCRYADFAELWIADRAHPTVLAWRKWRADKGYNR